MSMLELLDEEQEDEILVTQELEDKCWSALHFTTIIMEKAEKKTSREEFAKAASYRKKEPDEI